MSTKNMIGLGVRLAVFVSAVVAMLSFVHFLTRDTIAERKRQQGESARAELMAGCTFAEISDFTVPEDSGITAVYRAEKDGVEVGYCFDVTVKGYNTISMIVGVDSNLTVTGVKILSQTETPGIGSKVVAEDGGFLASFEGQHNPDSVANISGATLSSKGVRGGVSECVEFCKTILSEKEGVSYGKQ